MTSAALGAVRSVFAHRLCAAILIILAMLIGGQSALGRYHRQHFRCRSRLQRIGHPWDPGGRPQYGDWHSVDQHDRLQGVLYVPGASRRNVRHQNR